MNGSGRIGLLSLALLCFAGAIPAATLDEVRKFLGNDAPKFQSSFPSAAAVTMQLIAVKEKLEE